MKNKRQQFLQDVNEAYRVLRRNREEEADLDLEFRQLETTLSDGLEENENWTQEGEIDAGD